MSATDSVRRNKSAFLKTLCGDYRLILNKVDEKNIITQREYSNIKSINKEDVEGHVDALLDKIISKGEGTCQAFLKLLETDEEINSTYPELKNIQMNTSDVTDAGSKPESPTEAQAYMGETCKLSKERTGDSKCLNPGPACCEATMLTTEAPQCSQTAVARKDQTRLITLKPTTENFWKEKQKEDGVYTVTKKSIMSRVALLITNIKFDNEDYNRRGADIDEQNMEKLLKALNYEVVKYRNLTGKGIEEALEKFSKHPKLEHTDSVFVVIMSHGEQTAVHGVNFDENKEDKFPIDDIFTHLNTLNCPKLRNKPKIIIIQACSGGKKGGVFVSDHPSIHPAVESDNTQEIPPSQCDGEEVIEADFVGLAHREDDFLGFRSSTPGTVSYRHVYTGSVFIQYIVEVLNTFACEDHIEELFRKVMRRFKGLKVPTERGNDTQMPTKDRVTLSKNFYLFPGL